jgi:hypothetical protein
VSVSWSFRLPQVHARRASYFDELDASGFQRFLNVSESRAIG